RRHTRSKRDWSSDVCSSDLMVEGKQYELKPDDVVLIQAGELHRPIVHDRSVYERIILYLSPAFFSGIKKRGWDLFRCFGLPGQRSEERRVGKECGAGRGGGQ